MLYDSPITETPEEAFRSAYLAGAEIVTVAGHSAGSIDDPYAVLNIKRAKEQLARLKLTAEEEVICGLAGYLARGGKVRICPPAPNGYYPPSIQQLREIQRLEFLG